MQRERRASQRRASAAQANPHARGRSRRRHDLGGLCDGGDRRRGGGFLAGSRGDGRRSRATALAGRGAGNHLATRAGAAQIGPVALGRVERKAAASHDVRNFGLREQRIREQPD